MMPSGVTSHWISRVEFRVVFLMWKLRFKQTAKNFISSAFCPEFQLFFIFSRRAKRNCKKKAEI